MSYWKIHIKNLLKSELRKKNISHEKLVDYLAVIGINETKASIDSKLSRGTFSATFLIQCLHAIGCNNVKLDFGQKCQYAKEDSAEYLKPIKKTMKNRTSHINFIDVTKVSREFDENLKVVSLFSGAGGLDIGLEQAGYNTVLCVENDKHCRETLRQNRPSWKLFEKSDYFNDGEMKKRNPGDIRNISSQEILDMAGIEKGEAALVVGGAPCQPFSNIGKKKGEEDEKNGDLFLEFVRIVKGVSPKAFIFENVAGITQNKHNNVINYMLNSFSGLGYSLSFTILNAADYGVAQKRERFFLIGIKGSDLPAFPLPLYSKDKKAWDVFKSKVDIKADYKIRPWRTVKDAFEKIPPNVEARKDYALMKCTPKVVHRMTFIKQGENFKVLPMELRPNCWKNGKHQGQDTFGRLRENMPSVTIRTAAYNPAKGMYIHPYENRALNTIEMASLQDFPMSWQFKCHNRDKITLVSGGKQIGNAVPPSLAKYLGLSIRRQLSNLTVSDKKLPELEMVN